MMTALPHDRRASCLNDRGQPQPEKLPRIAILDHTAALGGGEIALLEFVRRLDREKFDPLVILFSNGPLCARLTEAGICWEIIELDPAISNTRKGSLGLQLIVQIPRLISAVRFVLSLRRYLKAGHFTLVHTNSLKSDILGGVAGRLAGIPVIWHVRDRINEDYLPPIAVKLFRFLARWLPAHIISNSDATRCTLGLAQVGKSRPTVRDEELLNLNTIHDGTNIAATEPTFAQPDPEQVKGVTVGLVGRITPWKGQHIFIQAAAEVHKNYPNAQFQIIGSALFDEVGYDKEIRQLVQTLGLTDCIHLLGFRSDVPELISRLAILVHASTTGEPFGQVIIEGMAAGKPIIATNGGGVPEIVVDGVTGILVPMKDATAMAQAIQKLIENPEMIDQMGRAGLLRAKSNFSIDRTVRKIERVYAAFSR